MRFEQCIDQRALVSLEALARHQETEVQNVISEDERLLRFDSACQLPLLNQPRERRCNLGCRCLVVPLRAHDFREVREYMLIQPSRSDLGRRR